MGMRFRKSVKVSDGTRINISKSGVGMSTGTKNARVGIGSRGTRSSVGVEGTGISYEKYSGARQAAGGHTLAVVLIVAVCIALSAFLVYRYFVPYFFPAESPVAGDPPVSSSSVREEVLALVSPIIGKGCSCQVSGDPGAFTLSVSVSSIVYSGESPCANAAALCMEALRASPLAPSIAYVRFSFAQIGGNSSVFTVECGSPLTSEAFTSDDMHVVSQ